MLRLSYIIYLLLSTPAYAQDVDPHKSDYLFQCGALYGILAEIYKEKNEMDNSIRYRSKFKTISKSAEEYFEKRGKSKMDAEVYMQEHVNTLVTLSSKDGRVLPSFTNICDRMFP